MRKILFSLAAIAALFASPAYADFTGKDASLATITFKNPAACASVVCVPVFQIYDGTNVVTLTTAGADGVSNTLTGVPMYGRNLVFNGTTWDRWLGDATNGGFVNVKASVLPALAATSTLQTTINTNITAINTVLGTQADSVCGSATGECSLIALQKYNNSVNPILGVGTNVIGKVGIDPAATAIAAWGQGATGAAVPSGAVYHGGDAQSSEPAKATTGNLTGAFFDLAGKQVTSPHANRENFLNCAVTITNTSATTCTGMAAQGASVKIYMTDLCITRNDAGTTAVSATLNDTATTVVDIPNNGGGGGFCKNYSVPLQFAANTAAQVTMSGSITSMHVSGSGFKGY